MSQQDGETLSNDGQPPGPNTLGSSDDRRSKLGDKVVTTSGYLFIGISVLCLVSVIALKGYSSYIGTKAPPYGTWLAFVQSEATSIGLMAIAIISALIGRVW